MRKAQTGNGGRLTWCVRAPYRALCRARDLYIRGMTGCAGRMHYGAAAPPLTNTTFTSGDLSRSSSNSSQYLSSGDEDLAELIRAASQSRARDAAAAEGLVRRSQSVAAVRIDEDAPFESVSDLTVGGSLIFPRSRSHAVSVRRNAIASARQHKKEI